MKNDTGNCGNSSMGGCQNYGPFLGTLNIRGRIIIGTQKGTIILTTTHIIIVTNIKRSLGGTIVLVGERAIFKPVAYKL